MIPYFQIDALVIGPLTIQVWGMMASLGLLAGLCLLYYWSKKYFLSEQVIFDLAFYAVLGGFIMARLFHVVFYQGEYYLLHPEEIFYFWQGGLSSIGGFAGALMAIYIFAKVKHFSLKELWPYFDLLSVGFWLGMAIGRIGCFLTHLHPGISSNFILAVKFPTGARHDLGLYDSILAWILFIIFGLSFKKLIKKRYGLVTILSFMSYALVRFWLDFLRATDIPLADTRYWHLTPAQWGMMVMFFGLTFLLIFDNIKQSKNSGEVA